MIACRRSRVSGLSAPSAGAVDDDDDDDDDVVVVVVGGDCWGGCFTSVIIQGVEFI